MANTSPYYFALATFLVLYFTASAQARFLGPLKFTKDAETICPDGSDCNDTSTCCESADGGYGCCPLKDAVCCADKVHCCPSGRKCDVARRRCILASAYQVTFTLPTSIRRVKAAVDLNDLLPAETEQKLKDTIGTICADRSTCSLSSSACCRRTNGLFSCCSYPNNVCCDGGNHCCPVGTVCDPVNFACRASPTNVDTPSYGWASGVFQPNVSPTRSSAAVAANEGDV